MTSTTCLMVKTIVTDTIGSIKHQFTLNMETDKDIIREQIKAHILKLFPRCLRCQIISVSECEIINY